jgi:hypothetical protein
MRRAQDEGQEQVPDRRAKKFIAALHGRLGRKAIAEAFREKYGREISPSTIGTAQSAGRLPRQSSSKNGDGTWKARHIQVWEESNGERPKGHRTVFRDGNRANHDIGNLMMIPRQEHLRLVTGDYRWSNDEELCLALDLIRLINKISDLKRKRRDRTNLGQG